MKFKFLEKYKKFLLLILLLIGVFVFILVNSNEKKSLNFDSKAKDYATNIKKPEGWNSEKIIFPGYDVISVSENSKDASINLVNPEINQVNFKFTVVFDKTNEILLESGLVSPGKAITYFPLPKNIKKGKYPITIKITTFSLKDNIQLNGTEIATIMEVE